MNGEPPPKSIWKSVLIVLRYFLAIVAAIGSVFGSGSLAFHIVLPLRGKNVSDVGVAMYENIGRAVVVWFLIFLVLSIACLFIIKRSLTPDSSLPYWIGGIVAFVLLPAFLLALHF